MKGSWNGSTGVHMDEEDTRKRKGLTIPSTPPRRQRTNNRKRRSTIMSHVIRVRPLFYSDWGRGEHDARDSDVGY